MRIITGQYKGRHFDIPRSFKGASDNRFCKENIFNVLQGYIDFEDTSALDLLPVRAAFRSNWYHEAAAG